MPVLFTDASCCIECRLEHVLNYFLVAYSEPTTALSPALDTR